jgi:Mg2+ and Co2+ transporter CorA
MYDFSLIDKFSESFESSSEDKQKHTVNNDQSNDDQVVDLNHLNTVIQETLKVYNKEVLNVSHINQEIDRLDRKNIKLKEKLKQLITNMDDIHKFVESNYSESNSKYQEIMDNIKTIQSTIVSCLDNIDEYKEIESNSHQDDYQKSVHKINSINQVFTVAKLNKHSCPICLRNECTHFTLPCGHVYCEECSQKMSVTCFVCRENIFKISPLFFT